MLYLQRCVTLFGLVVYSTLFVTIVNYFELDLNEFMHL